MKKRNLFLIIILFFASFIPKNVLAEQYSFYIAEPVSNLWIHKQKPNESIIHYNRVKIIREKNTNKIAYCIEPFTLLNDNKDYQETSVPKNYTKEQIENMSLLAYFGYGYKDHIDKEWYAITQLMIWKITNPEVNYFISNSINGPHLNIFNDKINELTKLVNDYKKNLLFNNNTYTLVIGEKIELYDENLLKFNILGKDIKQKDNKLTVTPKEIGIENIYFEKKEKVYDYPILFYQSQNNQDLIKIGNPPIIKNKITINTIETNINLEKIDEKTNNIAQGDANLEECEFNLYNEKEMIQKIEFKNNTKTMIKNLPFGNYYLKETKAGKGYNINNEKICFSITKENPKINIKIKNKVIEGTVIIKKEYGDGINFYPENNISFNIYHNKKLIKTITTDKNGIAKITLPYGKYHITQLTTTEGYSKIKPFDIIVEKNIELPYNFKNYKIEVPNTYSNFLIFLKNIIKDLICL